MNTAEAIGAITFSLSCGLKPWGEDPEEYWLPVTGKIVVSAGDDADPDAEATAGDLRLVVVKMGEVINDHVSLQQVFDAHSQELLDIYDAVFDGDGHAKEELRIECVPCDILFVESVNLKPKFRSPTLLLQILETTIATFATQGLVLARMNTLNMGDNEWTTCGFEDVPGTTVVFRDNVRIHPDRKLY
jgi:hypothetical protein